MFTSKRTEKLENFALQSSITNTLASLSEAQKIASKREDLEGLIVIAERWITIAEKIKTLDSGRQIMLGFTSDVEGPEEITHEPH